MLPSTVARARQFLASRAADKGMTALTAASVVQEVQHDAHLLRGAPRVIAATNQVIRAPSPA